MGGTKDQQLPKPQPTPTPVPPIGSGLRTICASGATASGIDVSHYQPSVSWSGVPFAFIKASEGMGSDSLFAKHWADSKASGVLRGAYHFFHPNFDPLAQAEHFCKIVLGQLEKMDLPCVMDWETTDGVPSLADHVAGKVFLDRVESLTGRVPLIYGSPYFLQALSLTPEFAKYPLWIAHYGARCPLVPAPFPTWTFWQYTDSGNLDKNVFNGSIDQLKAL